MSGWRRGWGRCSKPSRFIAVVAEKPKAARKIALAIGDGKISKCSLGGIPYWILRRNGSSIVIAPSAGHLFGPHSSTSGFPVLDLEWRPIFEFERGSTHLKKYYYMLSRVLPGAELYVNACDYDIEGSVICYKIIEAFGDVNRSRRMKFSTLSPGELRRSFERLHPPDLEMVEAGMARSEMDWLWGINISRALMDAARRATGRRMILSAGRVQSPTLVEAVRRWRERNLHVPIPTISIKLEIAHKGYTITAVPDGWKPKSRAEAQRVKRELLNQPKLAVESFSRREAEIRPPPPFNLGDLQKEAAKILKFPPMKTQRIAEDLYLEALISYPRTNSQKLPPTIGYQKIVAKLAKGPLAHLASELLTETGGVLKPAEGRKEDPAHPAIHPTGDPPPPGIDKEHQKVYELIVRRFLATFSTSAHITRGTARLVDLVGRPWRAEGVSISRPGWLRYYPYSKPRESYLPEVKPGEVLRVTGVRVSVEWPKPSSRLDRTSILRWMESVNIGTEGTRARIIETLYRRGYLEGDGARARVTPLGEAVAYIIETLFPDLSTPDLTRKFENMLHEIRLGKRSRGEVLEETKMTIVSLVNAYRERVETASHEIGVALGEVKGSMTCSICGKPASSNTGLEIALCRDHAEAFDRLSRNIARISDVLSLSEEEAVRALVKHKSSCGLWVRSLVEAAAGNSALMKAILEASRSRS
ncbi:MAG: DNA topoisomerase I [Aeropyrum sp.]|nr:DNA topoisomerase I [Aeropyrum sp.]MCE4616343.1 DNA topoisomerase I [Aeropyrum sp.]